MGATTKGVRRWGAVGHGRPNPFERYSGEWEEERHGQGTWAGTRGDTEHAAKEVHYEGMWARACAARRRATRTGRPSRASTGTTTAPGRAQARERRRLRGPLRRQAATASASAPRRRLAVRWEWRDDKPDTDAGRLHASEIGTAETQRPATKAAPFGKPGASAQLGAARVVPTRTAI